MRLAHLSDLHFGSRISEDKLRALISDVREQTPDLAILSGDITDRGTMRQFRQAEEFVRALALPHVAVPGNREICPFAPWEYLIPSLAMNRYRSFFGDHDRILYVAEDRGIAIIGLNSVHPFPSWPGRISRPTRYWLKEQAERLKGLFKALFLHHPVIPVVRSSSYWAHNLSDAAEVLNICTQLDISLIMQGHKHRSSAAEVRIPERKARVVVSACGAPLMPYWDSSYQLIDIRGRFITIQTREYEDGRFIGKTAHEFPPLNGMPD